MAVNVRYTLAVLAALVAGALLLVGCGGDAPSQAPSAFTEVPLEAPPEVPEDLKAIWEVWALLTRHYVDRSELDPLASTEAAIRGIISDLGNPHTNYLSAERFDVESQGLEGHFEGIGANISMRPGGKLIIVSPLEGSPAKAAGLRPGDIILEVDGVSMEGLGILEAVSRIRGLGGTKVRLLIQHLGAIDPVEIVVTRDVIPLISVLLRSEPGDRIAHIRLTDFNADTAQKMSRVIEEELSSGAEGLIIDVRDNPGGLLSSAVDVVSQFLESGLIVYTIDGSGNQKNHNVRKGGVATDIPMVVLANEFSASASEVLVGALQDHQRATVVGTTTFGKGSVGILRRLSNGGGVTITVSRFFTPSGRLIQDNGLEPDFEVVSVDRQKAEVMQLEKAIEVLESTLGLSDTQAGVDGSG